MDDQEEAFSKVTASPSGNDLNDWLDQVFPEHRLQGGGR